MTCLKNKKIMRTQLNVICKVILLGGSLVFSYCSKKSKLPAIKPDVISEQTVNDTDDPAIWINAREPSKSIVFGTDKATNGAIYAFDLAGKIIEEKTIRNIKRPNNVDIAYGFQLNDSTTIDVLVFTEREAQQIRLFSVPDMQPFDNGGFKVFQDEEDVINKLPMGIALYTSAIDHSLYAIVGRKTGPENGYLYQYRIEVIDGTVTSKQVRKFGKFSQKKEIEAIAVDAELGFIYYADEQHCIRKYHAEPSMGNDEITCFGRKYFEKDIEGIAIAKTGMESGYIIVSDQQRNQFYLFDRQTNQFIKSVNLSTKETDGCEVTTVPLNTTFSSGLFVAMNNKKNFYFFDFNHLLN